MKNALTDTPASFFAVQTIWIALMIIAIISLVVGYVYPGIRLRVHTLYINGRSIGLLLSFALWIMFSSFLWIINPLLIMNATYTTLAIVIFIIGTKVLAYER